jgi:hypothetical protein
MPVEATLRWEATRAAEDRAQRLREEEKSPAVVEAGEGQDLDREGSEA